MKVLDLVRKMLTERSVGNRIKDMTIKKKIYLKSIER